MRRVSAYQSEGWSDFGVATAGAGAALAGLLFVSLSINLQRILAGNRLTARAAHTLVLLGVPMVTALLLLIPEQHPAALGAELATGVVTGGWLFRLNRPWLRAPEQSLVAWFLGQAAPSALLSLSLALSGFGVLTGTLGGLYWLPVGLIAGLVAAMLNAWVLLVEILR
ncbi:modulator of FtsH protease [Saccharopolyspora erythraea NRRL 2338]|uniref:Uncharacterized protein n=1 Tax=Saccharopolyspora erythraea (strain ATCC 11635 / DSM 40517 / JCM 4748 / NBRC 13426 / NCIMB 8594 / NRRL 2338) TaxID=405948 RepID=A4FE46_SACEN|nr:hypothetical protein [Saccharopolyspora erythraea]PFG96048.1 modulator of FtsH protease [Saccharopolyspora erythraea NRRL 2338]CAM02321.1 hypothetical protein SACE_3043 [Saccharopolyspora erythraea NRRL 2338]